ncbi:Fe-S cluster assembly ATPase SufC [bacterium]|nr:Fe-S cluster assembly ATPase SufC [bacterium]
MELQIKNLTIQSDEKTLVSDASFSLQSGEIHILMGANGSGKSSLVNGIFSHPKYKITNGQILLNGENITALSPDKKARLGMFLSLQHSPEIDGVTFLNFFYRAYKELKNLPELSIIEFKKILDEKTGEYGLSGDFFKRNVNAGLSGGEKKLCEAFQLSLFEPRFAFLDEIDSGVDIDSLEQIFGIIRAMKERDTGFLLITHYAKILEKVSPDHVYVMKGGEIVREGGKELAEQISRKGFGNF